MKILSNKEYNTLNNSLIAKDNGSEEKIYSLRKQVQELEFSMEEIQYYLCELLSYSKNSQGHLKKKTLQEKIKIIIKLAGCK